MRAKILLLSNGLSFTINIILTIDQINAQQALYKSAWRKDTSVSNSDKVSIQRDVIRLKILNKIEFPLADLKAECKISGAELVQHLTA